MSKMIQDITDAAFEEAVMGSSTPVLVDFWAPWCGPCKMIGPILEELAGQYAERLSIMKMNVDEQPETASQYSVRGIPTLLIFKGGELVSTHVGLINKGDLMALIEKQL